MRSEQEFQEIIIKKENHIKDLNNQTHQQSSIVDKLQVLNLAKDEKIKKLIMTIESLESEMDISA